MRRAAVLLFAVGGASGQPAGGCTAGSGPCPDKSCPVSMSPTGGTCSDGTTVGPPGGGGTGGGGTGGGGAGGGSTPSTQCTGLADGGKCAKDGSSNFHTWTGSYNAQTGLFQGSLVTNGCSQNSYGYCAQCNGGQGMETSHQHTASCISLSFPASGYDTTPKAAPARGIVGLSVRGVNIYGPLEAGFGSGTQPNPCKNGATGVCSGGVDVPTCEASLEKMCGAANVDYGLMLDTCGGHAMPYHYHKDLKCDYDHTAPGHSPLIGIALDGRGVYGLYETSQQRPTDLDACNGHTGATPAFTGDGTASSVTSAASTSVYHYHVSSTPPYTIGCYGPADLASCKSVTTGCGDAGGYETIQTEKYPNGLCYDLECSCYDKDGMNNDGSACPALPSLPMPPPSPPAAPPAPPGGSTGAYTKAPTNAGDTKAPTNAGDTKAPTGPAPSWTKAPTNAGDTKAPTNAGDTKAPTGAGPSPPTPPGPPGPPAPPGPGGGCVEGTGPCPDKSCPVSVNVGTNEGTCTDGTTVPLPGGAGKPPAPPGAPP
eukprot:Hpha_TRINITY_DN15056_c0_g3::TRINITY_DN15056_c0_g3_i3::g.126085::m.126085